MKPTLAYQTASPPSAAAACAPRVVRLVTLSDRNRRHVIDDVFFRSTDDDHDGADERWPAAARLLGIASLGVASWAGIIAGIVALCR